MRTIALLMALLLFISLSARGSSPENIADLAERIREEVSDRNHDRQTLRKVKTLLEESLNILNDRTDQQACIEYTFNIYSQSMSSSRAMDQARVACRIPKAIEVLKVFFEYASQGLSSRRALDVSLEYASRDQFAKENIARFLISNYKKSLSTSRAIQEAGEALPTLRLGSLKCLKFSYEQYRRSQSNTRALKNAIESCQRN